MPSVTNNESTGGRVWLHGGLRCAMVALVLGLGSTQAPAQFVNEQKLVAAELVESLGIAYMGVDIDVSGNTILVGAYLSSCDAGSYCGSAYIYRFNGTSWSQTQSLTAVNPVADGRFGSSVSISETIAVVGSTGPTASVFRFNGTLWEHEQELPTPKSHSISVDQDRILVGSYNRGLATVYRFNGTSWYEEQTLTKGDEEISPFGRRVSLSGDTALVGAFDNAVYVYRFNGNSWVEEQKLTPSNPAAGQFGISVSVSGDTALIGARKVRCADGYLCGAAYVFRFNGNSWVEQQELTAPDATEGASFGYSVSLTEDRAVVGAISAICDAGAKCGATYVYGYDGTSWVQQQKLISAAAESGHTFFNEFGNAVAVDGAVIAVGEWHDQCPDLRQKCGSATVFRGPPPVPATSTWGLAVMTLLVLALGTLVCRHRTNGTAA